MRFKQIIKETADHEELFEKYFQFRGTVDFTPDGVIVYGGATLNDEQVSNVPVKFKKVYGEFKTFSQNLKNFNNFPNEAHFIWVQHAGKLESTKSTTGNIVCNMFNLTGANIQDFSNSSLKVNGTVTVEDCKKLESFNGLDLSTVKLIGLSNCDNFRDDLGKLSNLKAVQIQGNFPVNMPIMRLLITNKLKFYPTDSQPVTELTSMISRYLDNGQPVPKYAMQLMRELKDNGYFNAARM